jgi:hypothetical protein
VLETTLMIYRKAPPQPVRLLLRVVAGAGGTALAVACGTSSGSMAAVESARDAGEQDALTDHTAGGGIMGATDGEVSDVLTGTVANPEGGPCEDGGCGLVSNPDAAADVVTGVVVNPDGGGD